MQSPASAHHARSQWGGLAGLSGCSLAPHPIMRWRGSFPGCTQVSLRLWPPSISFSGGCPPGSPVPSSCLSGATASQSGGSKPLLNPSAVQQLQEPGQQRPSHPDSHRAYLLMLLERLLCRRSCPQGFGCPCVKPGHMGCLELSAKTHAPGCPVPALYPCKSSISLTGFSWADAPAAPREGS